MATNQEVSGSNPLRGYMKKQKNCVITPDGPGKILCTEMRLNTNGGPGTTQFRVQLDDGKIRHYSPRELDAQL